MSILSFLGFNLFSKVDVLVGLLLATATVLYTNQMVLGLLAGVFGTLGFSMAKDYFSPERIKNTLSIAYDNVKEKIFGSPSPMSPKYPAAPTNHPFYMQNRHRVSAVDLENHHKDDNLYTHRNKL